jgi:hypothetical protein
MKVTPQWLLTAAALGLALAGVSVARPSWPADLGVDFWNVPALNARLKQHQQVAVALEYQDEQVMRRIAVKEVIVHDLIAGRISLVEAAAQFRALNAGRRDYLSVIRATFPGRTDDERICRNVIGFVEAAVEQDEDGRYTVHRLNEELWRLADSGTLVLPGPPVAERDPPHIGWGDTEE